MTLQTFPPVMVDLVAAHEAARRQTAADVQLLGDVFIAMAAIGAGHDGGWQHCLCDGCAVVRRVKDRIGRQP